MLLPKRSSLLDHVSRELVEVEDLSLQRDVQRG
jgi:hypothetical protein